jgi:hypothetical protein
MDRVPGSAPVCAEGKLVDEDKAIPKRDVEIERALHQDRYHFLYVPAFHGSVSSWKLSSIERAMAALVDKQVVFGLHDCNLAKVLPDYVKNCKTLIKRRTAGWDSARENITSSRRRLMKERSLPGTSLSSETWKR